MPPGLVVHALVVLVLHMVVVHALLVMLPVCNQRLSNRITRATDRQTDRQTSH